VAVVAATTVVGGGLVAVSAAAFGPRSTLFTFALTWVSMTWLGSLSRLVPPRLPPGWFTLRSVERSGRLYSALGVRVVKRFLRRGPLAAFNPGLHLPAERTPAALTALDARMRTAEASHAIGLGVVLAVAAGYAVAGWWDGAGRLVLFDVLVNGYPVMLQRYNRGLLAARAADLTGPTHRS
jgi:hypothetical protein